MTDAYVLYDDPSEDYALGVAPKEVRRRVFAKRLQTMMTEREWSQADLHRKAGIGRDMVSLYVRGKNFPGPKHLAALCRAFNCEATELVPGVSADVRKVEGLPPFEMRSLRDGRIWLSINRAVSMNQAQRILQILNEEG